MEVRIDNFGRIVIPKKIRDRLGIQAGAKLRLNVDARNDGERLSLEPLRDEPVLQRRGHLLVHTGEFTAEATNWARRDREERIRKLGI